MTENSVEEVGPGARVDKSLRQKGRSFAETENSVEEGWGSARVDLVLSGSLSSDPSSDSSSGASSSHCSDV